MRTENTFMIVFNNPISGNPQTYSVGLGGVEAIIEHPAMGEGDRWFYDVQFQSGITERIFYPLIVKFETKQP